MHVCAIVCLFILELDVCEGLSSSNVISGRDFRQAHKFFDSVSGSVIAFPLKYVSSGKEKTGGNAYTFKASFFYPKSICLNTFSS
jgi:hypothetical protein